MHTPPSNFPILALLLLAKLQLESKGWGRGQKSLPIPYHTWHHSAVQLQRDHNLVGVAWVWLNVCLHIVSTEVASFPGPTVGPGNEASTEGDL